MAKGVYSKSIAGEFLAHANEELCHADQLAERIVQLGGEPDFSPAGLSRSHAEYVEGATLLQMITEDLVAERIAILALEERHAEELADLLQGAPAESMAEPFVAVK